MARRWSGSGRNSHHLSAWVPFLFLSPSRQTYILNKWTLLPPGHQHPQLPSPLEKAHANRCHLHIQGFRFCQALKVTLQSFHFPKNEWRPVGCVSTALEIQLFLSSWGVKLGRWNIQITDGAASGNHGIEQTVGAGCFTACGQRRH